MNLKNIVRKTIAGVMTAAAVSYLAGCAVNEAPDGDPRISDGSSAETVGSPAPDTEDSGAESTVDTPIVTDDAEPEDKAPTIQAQSAEAEAPVSSEAPWSTDADTADSGETAEPEPETDTAELPSAVIDTTDEQTWTETPASGTFYINDDGVSSREKPIQGSTRVNTYNTNDTVTVTAVTNTGYYKLSDGSFLHQDFTSSKKIDTNPAPAPILEQQPTTTTKPDSGSGSNAGSNSDSNASGNTGNDSSNTSTGKSGVYSPADGMELDANGLPVDAEKYSKFIDANGQGWTYHPAVGWTKARFGEGAHIEHISIDPNDPGWDIKVGY